MDNTILTSAGSVCPSESIGKGKGSINRKEEVEQAGATRGWPGSPGDKVWILHNCWIPAPPPVSLPLTPRHALCPCFSAPPSLHLPLSSPLEKPVSDSLHAVPMKLWGDLERICTIQTAGGGVGVPYGIFTTPQANTSDLCWPEIELRLPFHTFKCKLYV